MIFWGHLRAGVSLAWRWFRYWRKRYLLLRLLLICLIFAEPVYSVFHPLIRDLVIFAICGIETTSIPSITYHQTRYRIQVETKHAQRQLLAHFDADKDHRLSATEAKRLTQATGLQPAEVTGRSIDTSLDRLVMGGQKAHVFASSMNAREMRRHAAFAAQAEMDRVYQEFQQEQEPLLRVTYLGWRDYLRWKTWATGWSAFWGILLSTMGGFTGADWTPWRWLLFIVVPGTLISVYRYGRHERLLKRYEDDPTLAAAPCPRCHEPTHRFEALRQLRLSHAVVTGVVITLVLLTISALGNAMDWW